MHARRLLCVAAVAFCKHNEECGGCAHCGAFFFAVYYLIDGTNATHLPRWWRAHLPRWWRAQRTRERTPGAPPHPNLTFPHWRAQRAPTPPPSFQPFVDSKDRQERRKSPSWVSSQNCPEWDGAGGKSPKPGSRQQLVALSQTRTCRHEGSRFTRVERAFGKNSKMLSSPTAILAITAPRSCASSMLSKLEGSSWHPSVDGAAAFVSFTEEMYEAMLHDDARTSAFGLAISRRVRAHAGGCVVLDLGTGPFAVLALFAARAGASKVFAVEANPEAAAKARALIASSAASDIPPGTIEVIEGFSTTITLPEQADLLISEIAGSIASEEGMLATIRDARLRHGRGIPAPISPPASKRSPYLPPTAFTTGSIAIGSPLALL